MSKNLEIKEIFNHWNHSNIIVHKRLDKVMAKVIESVLKDGYDKDELKEAITLYAQVLHHPDTRWTYKWRIEEFFKRTPGFRHFLPESEPLEKFTRAGLSFESGGATPPASSVSPALKEKFLKEKREFLHDKH